MNNIKIFTMIELMMVITIIIIMAALLFPALQMAKNKTRQISCMSNLKQLGTALTSYSGDFNCILPRIEGNDTATAYIKSSLNGWVGNGILCNLGYIGTGRILYCPADIGSGFGKTNCLGSSSSILISSYQYRDGCEWGHSTLYNILQKAAWGWVIGADNFTSPQKLFHNNSVNILYADGHGEIWTNGKKGVMLLSSFYKARFDYFTRTADRDHWSGY